jgi:hypothetical protein
MQSGSRSRWTLAVIGGTALLLALAAAWRVVINARARWRRLAILPRALRERPMALPAAQFHRFLGARRRWA